MKIIFHPKEATQLLFQKAERIKEKKYVTEVNLKQLRTLQNSGANERCFVLYYCVILLSQKHSIYKYTHIGC